ncbi:MAG: hypothetical protein KDA51_16490 [Planctomycetales bacterium]|nr:hypothetical protein [Planctomycetales bacterium]
MAIRQQRRENLLLEATAYTRRALFRIPRAGLCDIRELSDPNGVLREWLSPFRQSAHWELFVGMRSDDSWSIYFDEQPVLQFNFEDRLRRLYADNQRYAAVEGRLRLLDRPARGGQVTFAEVEVDAMRHQSVLAACQWFLQAAADALQSVSIHRVGLIPSDDESWLVWFQQRLRRAADGFEVASTPSA